MALKPEARLALITGASHRIGAAMADALHERGWNILLHCNSSSGEAAKKVSAYRQKRCDSAQLVQADLSDPQQVHRLGERLATELHRLDALINNASLFFPTPVADADSLKSLQPILNVNALAPLILCHRLAPLLQKSGGRVLNLLDSVGMRCGYAAYDMSKAALRAMTLTLSEELAPVCVNALCPGDVLPPSGSPQRPHHQKALQQLVRLTLELTGRDCGTGRLVEVG